MGNMKYFPHKIQNFVLILTLIYEKMEIEGEDMIENRKRTITSLDEAKMIIFNLDNKVRLQGIKINSLEQENQAILQDNFVLYECLVRELGQKFSTDHVVELINCYKFNCQQRLIELREAESRAKFFEKQKEIYRLAFQRANIEGATDLLSKVQEEYEEQSL